MVWLKTIHIICLVPSKSHVGTFAIYKIVLVVPGFKPKSITHRTLILHRNDCGVVLLH